MARNALKFHVYCQNSHAWQNVGMYIKWMLMEYDNICNFHSTNCFIGFHIDVMVIIRAKISILCHFMFVLWHRVTFKAKNDHFCRYFGLDSKIYIFSMVSNPNPLISGHLTQYHKVALITVWPALEKHTSERGQICWHTQVAIFMF